MLAQRWPSIKTTLDQRTVFAESKLDFKRYVALVIVACYYASKWLRGCIISVELKWHTNERMTGPVPRG